MARSMRFGLIELPRSVRQAAEHARLAEASGFDLVGIADSQSVYRELYATAAVVARETSRVLIGPTVTNGVTRHPAVTASAIATVNEIAGGRAILGVGSGDSALLNVDEQPHGIARLRALVVVLKELLAGKTAEWNGRAVHAEWIDRRVPLYVSAEGPRTLELAGELADGVICGLGVTPEAIAMQLEHLRIGAARAGRTLDDLDVWAFARVNVGPSRDALVDEIRMELASTAHHAFRFTTEGKQLPPAFVAAVRRVQERYQTRRHEALGASPNAELMADGAFLDYMSRRFAIVGTPDDCVAQILTVAEAGITQLLFSGFVADRARLIRTLGESVIARVRRA